MKAPNAARFGIGVIHDIGPDVLQADPIPKHMIEQLVTCRWQWIMALNNVRRAKGASAHFDSQLAVCEQAIAIIDRALMPVTTLVFGPTRS